MTTTIIRRTIVTMMLVWLAVCSACSRASEPSAPAPAPAEEPFSFYPSAPAYEGPPFRFEVEIDGPATQFRWFVTVPTGGWEMKFEGGKADPRIDHGAVKVLLVRPGPDEMVTQAVEHLDWHYRHGKMNAKTAELLVRVVTRGAEEGEAAGDYRVAGTWAAKD